ncbi:olfactory receptor 52P1-like [Spea bombifrons]|uniref:olfactory receptor 52P1-like n=1 Tax=Spea bombifrons TaxID=233779 RepID=UPI00234AFAC9|nr:olfactory receptor 52P1-like [Spea bombifrons]
MPGGPNISFRMPPTFFLVGVPGLEDGAIWVSVSFCAVYILAVLGNCSLLYIIRTEKRLHGPMYFFLSMLALNDVAFSSSTVPKMLAIFWFGDGQVAAEGCLAQMFFVHSLSVVESGILASMAFDRFIAICYPLRYTSLLTVALLGRIAAVIVVRAIVTILPIPVLVGRLQYCRENVVSHSYCEHMAVVKLACGDTRVNSVYGLVLSLSITGFDLLFIGLSYAMILRAVHRLPSRGARHKAVGTCGSHVCVIVVTYLPGIFSFVTYRFGQNSVPHDVHVLFANIYILFPALLNPVIYGVKTKPIRERVLKTLLRDDTAAFRSPR